MTKEEENLVEGEVKSIRGEAEMIVWDAVKKLGRLYIESTYSRDRFYLFDMQIALIELILKYT